MLELISIINPINQIVRADIRHQKHQAFSTRHCKNVKKSDISVAMVIKIFRKKFQINIGSRPMTRKAVIVEMKI